MFDAHANLALAPVLVPPSPALSGTSLIITGGYAALFPAAPFNATVYPAGVTPTAANAEIVRVTNIVGDVFTITRAQEGTTAKAIASGWSIANTITVKVITDIENAISSGGSGIQSVSAGTLAITNSEVIFSNSNGVSFGASSNVITASFSGGGGGAAISAGANSQNTGTIQFSNSNGVTFGLSNNGVMTASHNGITSQSAQPVAASASNGSFLFSTLGFSNANNVTFGTSAGGIITASVATAAGGNSVNFSAGTESANLGSIVFSNSNGVSFGLNAGTVTAQHNGITSQSNQQNTVYAVGNTLVSSSGTNNASAFSFSGLGNVSVGVVGGSVLVSGQELAASASNGSFTFHTLAFSNANNVTFGTSAGGIVTASVNAGGGGSINFSAGTQSADLASIVFSNSNGVSFGLSNGTITASASGGAGGGATLSAFFSPDNLASALAVNPGVGGTFYCNAFVLPQPISFGFVRFGASMHSNSQAAASLASASASAFGEIYQTMSVRIYSMGTGASVESFYHLASTTGGSTWRCAVTISNSTQMTVSQEATAYERSNSYTLSNSYAASSSNYRISVTGVGEIIGARYFDIPFAASLPAGNYMLMVGRSAESSNDGVLALAATGGYVRLTSLIFGNQVDSAYQVFGDTLTNFRMALNGGIYASTGTNLSNEFHSSQVTRLGTNARIYFQLSN